MRQWWRPAAVTIVAIALQVWGCKTEIAPQIDTERRFVGSVQAAPPPAPPAPFDMSLFLRKLSVGQQGVSGGFNVSGGQVRGTVNGTLAGNLDDGSFAGRLSAPERTAASGMLAARSRTGVLAFMFFPSLAMMQAGQCVVEQEYNGSVTAAGIVWTPRDVVRSCPTNPLGFTIAANTVVQAPTTSVSSTSTIPTTSISTTTTTSSSTTTSEETTSTTTVRTTSTTTSTSSTTTTTTSTTTIPPI